MVKLWRFKPGVLILMGLAMLTITMIACGADATPVPVIQEKVVTVEVVKEVPVTVVKIQQVEVPQLVTVVATPTPGPAPETLMVRYGGTVTMPIYGPPSGFDPHASTGTKDGIATSPLYNGLIEFNPETPDRSDLRGDLAETWEVSPDGQGYIFKLRADAKWSDGKSVTSEDVAWSMDRMVDPEASRPRSGQIRDYYDSVNIIDDRTVEWRLQFSSQSALFYLAIDYMKILPKHHASVVDISEPDNVMGSGPFKLKEFKKDISFTHERRDDYWKRPYPYLDELKVFPMSESATIIAAFKTGRVMTSSNPTTGLGGPDDALLAQDLESAGTHHAEWTISPSTMGIRFNHNKPPFDSADVRKAVHLAINRKQVIDDMTPLGKAPPSVPLMAGFWFGKTLDEVWDLPGYRYVGTKDKHPGDLADAQKLMQDAGYGDGFKANLSCRQILDWCQVAEILKQQLKEINIDVTIEGREARIMAEQWEAGNWDFAFDGAGYLVVEPDAMFRIYRGGDKSYKNYQDYYSQKFEDFADAQTRELDPVKRRAILQEAEDWLLSFEDNTWSGIYVLTLVWMVNNNIMNWNHTNGDHDGLKWEHIWLADA